MSAEVGFSRLTADDAPEAAAFLNEVWGAHYGPGAPVFTPDYLRWLYGGPDADRHSVLACRWDGRLIGLRAMLNREVSTGGKVWTAYLSTHFTLHPGVSPALRAEARDRLLDSSSLLADGGERSPSDARHLLVAYFEETKPTLIQRTERRAADQGVTLRRSTFNQAVVSPAILQASVASSGQAGGLVRPVREDDVAELGRLLDRVARRHPLSFTMGADRLRHHVLSLPQGRSYLVEEQGVPAAFIMFYPMDTLSGSGPSRVVVVELLINDGMREASCLLLDQALSYARASDARGVVIENPTCLDAETRQFCGIVPSTRRMVITTRSCIQAFECDGGFLCDVK